VEYFGRPIAAIGLKCVERLRRAAKSHPRRDGPACYYDDLTIAKNMRNGIIAFWHPSMKSSNRRLMETVMVWLDVPYASKGEVKRIGGARWNPDRRSWYLPPSVNRVPFATWVRADEPGAPVIHPTFAACDRPQAVLIVVMVPKSAWYSNLWSLLSADEWKKIQQASFRRARWPDGPASVAVARAPSGRSNVTNVGRLAVTVCSGWRTCWRSALTATSPPTWAWPS